MEKQAISASHCRIRNGRGRGALLSNGTQYSVAMKQAKTEREALRSKAAALTDLLEVSQAGHGSHGKKAWPFRNTGMRYPESD